MNETGESAPNHALGCGSIISKNETSMFFSKTYVAYIYLELTLNVQLTVMLIQGRKVHHSPMTKSTLNSQF